MADIYFGDGVSSCDGDWNNVSNWYSSKGDYCCGYSAGTPMGRLPVDGSDIVHIVAPITANTPAVWNGGIVMEAGIYYPTTPVGKISSGVWNGTITGGGYGQYGSSRCELAGGTFNNTVTCQVLKISGGTFASAVTLTTYQYSQSITQNQITGGTFNAAVVIEGRSNSVENACLKLPDSLISAGTFNSTVNVKGAKVTGGTFYGTVTSNMPFPAGDKEGGGQEDNYVHTRIAGGTYMPLATVALIKSGGAWTLDPDTLPLDPGFKQGGGTFSPRFTLTGLPDILGAGL